MIKMVKGYKRGMPFDLRVIRVDDVFLSLSTARAFLAMRTRAAMSGIDLFLVSGFRSMKAQRRLFEVRKDPDVAKAKGQAAQPGFSAHQSGRGIDIKTGLTKPTFLAGRTSKVWRWLTKNAPSFGFRQTVPGEPWHWVYVGAVHYEPRTTGFGGFGFLLLMGMGALMLSRKKR